MPTLQEIYSNSNDINQFTDAEKSKLAGITDRFYLWGEQNAPLAGGYEYSFGNGGEDVANGMVQIISGKLIGLSVSAVTKSSGTTRIELHKNNQILGTDAFINLTGSNKSNSKILTTPINFNAGDKLHFFTDQTADASVVTVGALIELDIL